MTPPLAFGPLTTSTWPLLIVAVVIWAIVFARELSRGQLARTAWLMLKRKEAFDANKFLK
jgi:hypothetical protein